VHPDLPALAEALLARDPRPAYQQDAPGRIYGIRLYDLDVRWSVADGEALIIEMVSQAGASPTAS
jgi:hypothetical protein